MNAARSMILESIIIPYHHCILSYHAVGRRLSVKSTGSLRDDKIYITFVKCVLEKLVVCCTIFSRFQEGQFDL